MCRGGGRRRGAWEGTKERVKGKRRRRRSRRGNERQGMRGKKEKGRIIAIIKGKGEQIKDIKMREKIINPGIIC